METPVFRELQQINQRPAIWSRLTATELWTDPYVARQMLRFHLDETVDLSSRRPAFIDASARWIANAFGLGPGTRVLDLGCGPGLYTTRFAQGGADVTGVDFSASSIDYARETAARDGLDIRYVTADYLEWECDERFDLVTLIYLDFCPLAPRQRAVLLARVERMLAPGGAFLFDVCSMARLGSIEESASYWSSPGDDFWAAGPHFGFVNTFVYGGDAVTLEKHVIVEAERTRVIFNWLQHYSPESLAAELAGFGLCIDGLFGDVAGRTYDPEGHEFAVVVRRAGGADRAS